MEKRTIHMKTNLPLLFLTFSLLAAVCGGFAGRASTFPAAVPSSSLHATETNTPIHAFTQTLIPSPTGTDTAAPTFTRTFTPSSVPTATWVSQGPNAVEVPILLYHRIEAARKESRYSIAPEKFEEQMRLLHNWEYRTITVEMLVQAITEGASLPPRPILITFDDGHLDNYTTAWPIMEKYGFTGVLYVVSSYIGADGYMTADQIVELYQAGWEVGSHSIHHLDLTSLEPERQRYEIVESRSLLQDKLGLPVTTFAYPFGEYNRAVADYVEYAGYIAGMGATGFAAYQDRSNLFFLQRCEIEGWEDARTFIRFLPWHGDPAFLPTDTPTPSPIPSRTPKP